LKIAKTTLNESKKASLKKIKRFLENDPTAQNYLIGGEKNSPLREGSQDENIARVYRQDLQGSYLK
jgi:hypothetical protein